MFVSRKKQKNTLLRTIELAIEMGDVQSAQSLYEAWEKHFRLNGALMKLDHPDIQKSIQDGIISRRSVDIYIKNKAAYLASNMK
jgi:hypothetical protein